MDEFVFDESVIYPRDPTATPERIAQYKEYYPLKYKICKAQKPKRIAEIGVRAGYSAWTFLQASPGATYIGIDANNGKHGGQGGADGRFFEWAKQILSPYDAYLIELDTQTVDDLMIAKIDFFHVDGDHTEEGVIHDLDLAWKAINIDGLILVDDITYLDTVKKGVVRWIDKKNNGHIVVQFVPSIRGEMLIWKKK